MSLHSAPSSRKGETDSCRLSKDFPDTRKETLQAYIASNADGLKETGKITTKGRPYTTCCLKTGFTSCPMNVLVPHTLLWNLELLISQSRRKHLCRTGVFWELICKSPGGGSWFVWEVMTHHCQEQELGKSTQTMGLWTHQPPLIFQPWEMGFLSPATQVSP